MKAKTNGERFDEFMEGLNQPPYPELEGTLEVCKDIINFRTSEISDEEIEKEAGAATYDVHLGWENEHAQEAFIKGAIWYREQLKLRKL